MQTSIVSHKQVKISIKNISKGPVAFGPAKHQKYQIGAGDSFTFTTAQEFEPYKKQVLALCDAGLLQLGDKPAAKTETPHKLEQELKHKEAAKTAGIEEAPAPVLETPPDASEGNPGAIDEMNAAIAQAEQAEAPPAEEAKPTAPKPQAKSGKKNK